VEQIINIREYPEWIERAADYFSSRWNIDKKLYLDSMSDSLSTEKPVPRWYLMLRGDNIIGGFGLIDNDFMVRTDLCPWLCALYIEPAERGLHRGAKLLAHGCLEAAKLGFAKVYLNTSHVGYYEKYGWRYTGDFAHQDGEDTRVYEADTLRIETTRLILRPFADYDATAASYNSRQPIVAHFMSDMVLEDEESARKWIKWLNTKCNTYEPCQVLAVERKEDATVIGLVGIAPKKELGGEVEILFEIADEYQNNGYATEAGKAMIWWTFEKAGQEMLSAIVKPENKASRRVIEKLGFVYGDTLVLPYNGADCEFDYFRLYHIDYLPNPEWDINNLYKPEPMGAFFDTRADGYNDHMLAGQTDEEDYIKLGDCFPKTDQIIQILDIGCGTGIELNHIWKRCPNAHITCVDVSRGMLELLLKNHQESHDNITIVEASYIDWSYPENVFDIVVSNMTMHHLWPEEKVGVYRKILDTLKSGGSYIEGDFIVESMMSEQYRKRYENITAKLLEKANPGEYHIDIPCTVDVQQKLLKDAGFGVVEVLDTTINRGNGAILSARK